MKLFFYFVFFIFFFCLPLLAEEVIVKGTAKIYNNDQTLASEQALKNALLEAVKKGVESILDGKTISTNYEVIKNQIYRNRQKYISNYEIISEKFNLKGATYEIQILAKVERIKIQQKLKVLRILHDRMLDKFLLFVYHRSNVEAVPRNDAAVKNVLSLVQKTYAKYGIRAFGEQTMKHVYSSLEQESLVGSSVDVLIGLALNYNADILVVMEMIAIKPYKTSGTFYKVGSKVHLKIYKASTGQQIAKTIVEQNENSIKKPDEQKWKALFGKAAKQAVLESIRQSAENIVLFYQNANLADNVFSVVFKGYSLQNQKLIVEYLENTIGFRRVSELKNTFGYLEIELNTLMHKSTLRRRITSDLLLQKIEVAIKSLAGNQLFFINPNPMEEEN